jgi:hypothetical protein
MATDHTIIPFDYLIKNSNAILDPLEYDVENQNKNYKIKEDRYSFNKLILKYLSWSTIIKIQKDYTKM